MTDPMDPKLFFMVLALQGLWGLFLLILGIALKRIVADLDKNTKATESIAKSIGNLNLSVALNNPTKEEFLRLEAHVRNLNDRVVTIEATRTSRIKGGD